MSLQVNQSDDDEIVIVNPVAEIIAIETLREHRQLTRLQEWLQAQLPWQRADAQRIRDRIRAA
jgi:hypothetical protein